MAGPAEDRLDRAGFHDLAVIDDHDLVGDIGHHAEIVRDQQHRHVELGLQVAQQLQDLRLDRHVERRRRLVGDQQGGAADQRHGDHRALAQAARKLERIHVVGAPRVGKADKPEHLLGASFALGAQTCRCGSAATSPIWLPIVCSGDSEVIGSWKILPMRLPRNALISGPSRGICRMSAVMPGVCRVGKQDAAANMRGFRQNSHHGLADDRLAGAGLAHQRGHLAGQDAQIGPPDRMDRAANDGKRDAEVLDPQQIGA